MIVLILLFNLVYQLNAGSVPNIPLEFRSQIESNHGLGWPQVLHIVTGHDALIKLTKTIINQQWCTIRTPLGQTFNVTAMPSDRFQRWGDGCDIKVRNITKSDEGRWKLISARGEDSIMGYSEVHVSELLSATTNDPITLIDGSENIQVNLTILDNSYCMVTQPFSQSALVPGHCSVTLDKVSRAVKGTWRVQLGMPGQVAELPDDRTVVVEGENLDVGYIYDTNNNKLHLYCNVLHSEKNISFCRFQRTLGSSGYNVIDGLSDGLHSYYGDGFVMKKCGLTLENPASEDFTTWRCSVGVQVIKDEEIVHDTPMQALISVSSVNTHTQDVAVRNDISDDDDTKRVFTEIGATLKIDCQADVALSYCWFQHPNGSQYTPVARAQILDGNTQYWYSGESLQMGDCSISFTSAEVDFSGTWTCHMGSSVNPGVEITDRFVVRVTGPLAANQPILNVVERSPQALHCHTSGVVRSLSYCRFVNPNFIGLNINPDITAENAVMGRYYFTPGKSLDHGDCSLTIDPVLPEDEGNWTCAALIVGLNVESRDYIHIYVEELPSLSQASVVGIVIGTLLLVCILGGVVFYRKMILGVFGGGFTRTVRLSELSTPSARVSNGSTDSDSSTQPQLQRP